VILSVIIIILIHKQQKLVILLESDIAHLFSVVMVELSKAQTAGIKFCRSAKIYFLATNG